MVKKVRHESAIGSDDHEDDELNHHRILGLPLSTSHCAERQAAACGRSHRTNDIQDFGDRHPRVIPIQNEDV